MTGNSRVAKPSQPSGPAYDGSLAHVAEQLLSGLAGVGVGYLLVVVMGRRP